MWPGVPFFHFGAWFFFFLECGKVFVVIFFVVIGFLSFLFSVTLPGTNASRSAVTRGKPILFGSFFASRAL